MSNEKSTPAKIFKILRAHLTTLPCVLCGGSIVDDLNLDSSSDKYCYRSPCGHLVHQSCVTRMVSEGHKMKCSECRIEFCEEVLLIEEMINRKLRDYSFLGRYLDGDEFCETCGKFVTKFTNNPACVAEENCTHSRVYLNDMSISDYVSIPDTITEEEACELRTQLSKQVETKKSNVSILTTQRNVIDSRTEKVCQEINELTDKKIGELSREIRRLEENRLLQIQKIGEIRANDLAKFDNEIKTQKLDNETFETAILTLDKFIENGGNFLVDKEYYSRLASASHKQFKIDLSFSMMSEGEGFVYNETILSSYDVRPNCSISGKNLKSRVASGIFDRNTNLQEDDYLFLSRTETNFPSGRQLLPSSAEPSVHMGNYLFIFPSEYDRTSRKRVLFVQNGQVKELQNSVLVKMGASKFDPEETFSNRVVLAKFPEKEKTLLTETYDISGNFEKVVQRFNIPLPAWKNRGIISFFNQNGEIDPIAVMKPVLDKVSHCKSITYSDLTGNVKILPLSPEKENSHIRLSMVRIFAGVIYIGMMIMNEFSEKKLTLKFVSFKRNERELTFIDEWDFDSQVNFGSFDFFVDCNQQMHVFN